MPPTPIPTIPIPGGSYFEFEGRIAGGGLILSTQTAAANPAYGPRATRGAAVAAPVSRSETTPQQLNAKAAALARQFARLSPAERLVRLRREVAGKIVFTTSFGLEDQVILHLLSQQESGIEVLTLDTGRLFPETHALWAQTECRYGLRIRALCPRHADLEALIERQGIDGFYHAPAARSACCAVRKVEPLERALAGAHAWITGLRAEQSAHRRDMGLATADAERGLIKLNPLFDWTCEQLLMFVSDHDLPVNPLHAQGFASIGCAPCTRALAPASQNAPDAGGGRRKAGRSADCIRIGSSLLASARPRQIHDIGGSPSPRPPHFAPATDLRCNGAQGGQHAAAPAAQTAV